MNTSSYLIPDNPIALAIVYFLIILFAIWFIALGIRWVLLASRRKQVRRCADVGILADALRLRLSLNKSDETTPSDPGEFKEQAHAAFVSFCETKKLNPKSTIAKHLRAIFDAGINESRLDISPLVKNTSSYLLRASNLFRSALSLFIIIGLLGTLVGLASTLGELSQISPEEQAISTPSNNQNTLQPTTTESIQERAAKRLKTLLEQLKSAFAPSIWGVSFTILGVFIFGLFLHLSHTPLQDALERHTLVDWVPALIPTPSQSLWEKLQVSEKQIQASLESAKDVAKLAASLQDDSSDLSKSIRDAKETIPQLTTASIQLGNFSDKFVNAVNALTPFQKELHQLYEQLQNESKTFHDAVKENIERDQLFQSGVREQLDSQKLHIVTLLHGFNAYEKAYIATRERIDKNLDQLLQDAKNAYQSLAERNKEVISTIVSALRDPLSKDLAAGLGKVENSLDVRLTALSKSLELLHSPLERAAGGLEGTLENLNNRTEILLKEVQQEFFNRNRLQEQQVAEIVDLTDTFSNLLAQLSSNNKVLTEYEQVLGTKVNELAQNVGSLGGNINLWNQSFSSGEFSNLLEQIASNNKLLTEYEQVLGTKVNELAENIGSLGGNVNGLNQSLSSGKFTNLLEQLASNNKLLTEYERVLGAKVNELAQNVGSLGGNINVLSQSISSNGRVSESESRSESTAELKRLVASNEQLVTQLQTLVNALKKQRRPTDESFTPPPIEFRQPTSPPVESQQPTPPSVELQPPVPEKENLLKRSGKWLSFWRR
jgi:hypothetical protein